MDLEGHIAELCLDKDFLSLTHSSSSSAEPCQGCCGRYTLWLIHKNLMATGGGGVASGWETHLAFSSFEGERSQNYL